MRVKKKLVGLGISLLLISQIATNTYAATVTGIRSLNNDTKGIDYKLTTEELRGISDNISVSTDIKEVIPSVPERNTSDLSITGNDLNSSSGKYRISDDKFKELTTPVSERELVWLIENNIISRQSNLSFADGVMTSEGEQKIFSRDDLKSNATMTEFLVGIYKAIYSPIESRPIIYTGEPYRVAGEEYEYYEKVLNSEGEEVSVKRIAYRTPFSYQNVSSGNYKYIPVGQESPVVAKFSGKDLFVYIDSNVTELYLKELLDKRIIKSSQLSDRNFEKEYRDILITEGGKKKVPHWFNNSVPFYVGSVNVDNQDYTFSGNSGPLGKSIDVDSSGNIKPKTDVISKEFFINEKIDTMTALKYIEAMLRMTEKDMTDTEARIVTYKYGASFLDRLEDADRRTVMFLTAKGVLNFEDPNEYRSLYSLLTKEFSYKLFYRVANKSARLNFSEIQLTDSDNFWIEQGFGQLDLSFKYLDESLSSDVRNKQGDFDILPIPDVQTVSVERDTRTTFAPIKEKNNWGMFKVSSTFAEPELGDSNALEEANKPKPSFIVEKRFDDGEKYQYRGVRVSELEEGKLGVVAKTKLNGTGYTIKFGVDAASSMLALAQVDSAIQAGTDYMFDISKVSAVSKITEDGKQVILVPASFLRDNNPIRGERIMLLEDKVLKNVQTGTTAVILKEKNMALIGTHVVTGKELILEAVNGEIYYNLEIIRTLLSNAYINSIDPNGIYVSSGIIKEQVAKVFTDLGTHNNIGSTYVTSLNLPKEASDNPSTASFEDATFINISQMDSASNILIKNFEVLDDNRERTSFKLVMQLIYRIPDRDMSFLNPIYKRSNPTLTDVNSYIYERPEDPELADWWDNNIEISNAFANEIYGTRGVKYVNSGYLMPNITILYNKEDNIQKEQLSKFFMDVGTHLSKEWVTRFIGDDLVSYNQPVSRDSSSDSNTFAEYYPTKQIPKDMFPLWVHAMFNNSTSSADRVEFTGGSIYDLEYAGIPSRPKKNTLLWRHLMVDRNLSYNSAKFTGGGLSVYLGDGQVFAVTNGDAVYLKSTEEDPKFPSKVTLLKSQEEHPPSQWKSDDKLIVRVLSRTPSNNLLDWVGRYVYDEHKILKMYVKAVSGNKLILMDAAEIKGVPVHSKRGNKSFLDIKGEIIYQDGSKSSVMNKAIESRYKELLDVFTKSHLVGYEGSVPSFENAKVTTVMPPSELVSGRIIYVDSGKSNPNIISDLDYIEGNSESKKYSFTQMGNQTPASAYVALELDTNLWYISDNGELIPKKTFPFVQVGNVYLSGINKTIMDSILAQYIGTTRANSIPEGATLIIGDITFKRIGSKFVSAPVTNISAWKNLLSSANNKKIVEEDISKSFVGMSVDVSGKNIPLTNFITSKKLDVPWNDDLDNITVLGGGKVEGKAYLHKYKKGAPTTTEYNNKDLKNVGGIVFSIELDDNLLARKLDLVSNTYQLLFATNTLAEGYLDEIPFFTENLKVSEQEDLYLIASKVKFNAIPNAGELKERFLEKYKKTVKGNVFTAAQLLVLSVISYMIVISWLAFVILKANLGRPLLEAFRNPGPTSTRSGVDLVKWISFGMFSLDTELSLSKLIVSNLLMFTVIYAILGFV